MHAEGKSSILLSSTKERKEMFQVVVYTDEYGSTVFSEDEVEVLEFDFTEFTDRIPDGWALSRIKPRIDKINKEKLPEAYKTLTDWYNENKKWHDEILQEEERYRLEEEQKELEEAKKVIEKHGLKLQ